MIPCTRRNKVQYVEINFGSFTRKDDKQTKLIFKKDFGFLPEILQEGGAKSIIMKFSFVMLIFLLS